MRSIQLFSLWLLDLYIVGELDNMFSAKKDGTNNGSISGLARSFSLSRRISA